MEGLDSEKEQLAQIKKWIQENGLSLVLGVVLGLGGVYGWRGWQDYRVDQSEVISAKLAEAIDKLTQQQYEEAATLVQTVADEKQDSMHGDMALLMIAGVRVQQGLLDEAAESLQTITSRESSIFEHTARLRLARIFLAQSKYEEAKQLIPKELPEPYTLQYEELRGDIAFSIGDHQQAKAAYMQAIATATPAEDLEFLQMKLDELSAAGE